MARKALRQARELRCEEKLVVPLRRVQQCGAARRGPVAVGSQHAVKGVDPDAASHVESCGRVSQYKVAADPQRDAVPRPRVASAPGRRRVRRRLDRKAQPRQLRRERGDGVAADLSRARAMRVGRATSLAIARGAWSIAGMYKSTHWPGSKVSDDSSSSSRAEVDGESGETSAIVAHVSGAAFACVESLRRTGKVSRDSRRSMCIGKPFLSRTSVVYFLLTLRQCSQSLLAESLRRPARRDRRNFF